jgi:signal peptidase I
MYPTVKNESLVLIRKTPFSSHGYLTGQIVMFKRALNDQSYIKRVVALPNDKVEIRNNALLVNQKLFDDKITIPGVWLKDNESKTIGACLFMLGDNRLHSIDSRDFGCIERKDITGTAVAVIWPPSEIKIIK